ncbi:hypothetical protein [Pseudolactococcus insecticola]|uniref:Uncharacterized protein n=1 Tax=Pseudolactococcus insecticola TaxID=2709158 RepID=A0A6A0B861_9LACT|nr:hypothetical protein [Lactococcus insecticola]GFH40853.1 hypothetical protein Hs20B_12510 [Lactococcus insecticola]
MRKIVGTFGEWRLSMDKEDIKKNPDKPQIRFYDDGELIGIFDLKTLNILYDNEMSIYDIKFAKKTIGRNQDNYLETWQDYVSGVAHA